MLVKDKMTKFPVTVDLSDTLASASRIMHEKNIRHLPVLEDGKLVGLLCFTDIMRAMPSKVNTLEQHEATYLFSTLKVRDALPERQKVVTAKADACIEEAALIMRSYKIGCLPVLDKQGNLVGLCTENDIFDAFIDLLGVRSSGSRISIAIGEEPGIIADITAVIKSFNANITKIGMLPTDDHHYLVVIRLKTTNLQGVVEALAEHGYQVESSADYSSSFTHSL